MIHSTRFGSLLNELELPATETDSRRTNWQPSTVEDNNTRFDFAKDVHRLPEHRRQLIYRVRREIAEGTYDTDEKLDAALDRLLDRHFQTEISG
jgi:hypothetical protein